MLRSAFAALLGLFALDLSTGWTAEVRLEQNLTYATVDNIPLQLDLAHPATGDGPFPAIVFIHGGGWSGGNRHSFNGKMQEAAAKGYVAVTISYRLTQPDPKTGVPKVPFPAQIHDCKAAIRWLRGSAEKYKIDPERIGVIGASAGGHLSLLAGLTEAADGLEGTEGDKGPSSRVQAVVNIFGPTDLPALYKSTPAVQGLLKALCNGTPEDAAETYRQASPVTFITAGDPPILTLHGDSDEIVPVVQAEILDKALKQAGISHEMKVFAGQGHGFGGTSAVEADAAIWAFFATHLKP